MNTTGAASGAKRLNNCDGAESSQRARGTLVKPGLILFLVCFFLGLYCCQLNKRLYVHRAPFYDSLSYNERLFEVMTKVRRSGFADAMKTACNANSTNCLPFVVAAAIAPFVEPSRLVGIWIQSALLFCFLFSLYYYLSRVRRLSDLGSLAGCLAFLVAKCFYFENGGLSDFRMDLSMFLGFALTSVWFLCSMEWPRRSHFILMGVAASLVCLCRATAPIYLVFALGPLLILELLRSKDRTAKIKGILWAVGVVVALAGWFFWLNFDYLKYYYFDWNTDANAKIPFVEALHHWKLTQRSVGEPFLLLLVCWGAAVLIRTAKSGTVSDWIKSAVSRREVDWRIGWLGISAVVLMVARRAGLNPFVCMPSVFGLVMFFVLPLLFQMDRLNHKGLKIYSWVVLVGCILISGARGWVRHSPDEFKTMGANHFVIDAMVDDSVEQNRSLLHFGVAQITDFDANILYSVMLFDRPDGESGLESVSIKGVELKRIPTFSQPAVADWKNVAGDTDDEKIAALVEEANRLIHYLVVPDKETARRLPETQGHNVVNQHVVKIRESFVNDEHWVRIKTGIQTTQDEFVEIYRNSRLDIER